MEVWYAGGKPGCAEVFLDPQGPLKFAFVSPQENSRNLSQSPQATQHLPLSPMHVSHAVHGHAVHGHGGHSRGVFFFREMIKHHTILQTNRVQDQDQKSKTKFYCSFTAGYTFPGKNPELHMAAPPDRLPPLLRTTNPGRSAASLPIP